MPGFRAVAPVIGYQKVNVFGLPDTVQRHPNGFLLDAVDSYWGGARFIYGQASGTIRMSGLCIVTPAVAGGAYNYAFSEVPNTANLAKPVYVAMTNMTASQWGWFMASGVCPLNCTASVTADTTFGIAAAGQGGANSAGKQILSARVVAPATTTVAINGVANSGSTLLSVNGSNGWFVGAYLSGTGIAAGTTIVDIDPSGTQVTLSAATTAAVNGTVTATYNNATVFYNIVHVSNPIAQGAIT